MYIVENLELNRNKTYKVTISHNKKNLSHDISQDLVVEYRLVKGKEMSKEDYKLFIVSKDRDQLYQKVLHYALYKMRSTKEIIDYLNKKDVPKKEHDYFINKLIKSRILDDIKYAEIYTKEKFDFKKLGPDKIIYELEKQLITSDIYQTYINRITNKEINENLTFLFNKKLKTIKNKSTNQAIKDITKFLVEKGYSYELVKSFMTTKKTIIKSTINDLEVLQKDFLVAKRKYKNKGNINQSIIAYLLRKGYNYNDISNILRGDSNEENDRF